MKISIRLFSAENQKFVENVTKKTQFFMKILNKYVQDIKSEVFGGLNIG